MSKQAKLCPETWEDKYDLGLQVKIQNKDKLKKATLDPTYKKWNEQTEDKFGFIPLSPVVLSTPDNRNYMGSDPIKLYDITKNENMFNFMSAQVQLDSQLNGVVWENLLQNYWD